MDSQYLRAFHSPWAWRTGDWTRSSYFGAPSGVRRITGNSKYGQKSLCMDSGTPSVAPQDWLWLRTSLRAMWWIGLRTLLPPLRQCPGKGQARLDMDQQLSQTRMVVFPFALTKRVSRNPSAATPQTLVGHPNISAPVQGGQLRLRRFTSPESFSIRWLLANRLCPQLFPYLLTAVLEGILITNPHRQGKHQCSILILIPCSSFLRAHRRAN